MSNKKRGIPFWIGPKNKESEVDITHPDFWKKLSKTRMSDSDPMPLNHYRAGGSRHVALPKNSSKTRY